MQFPEGKKFSLFFFFFLRQGTGRKALRKGKLYPLLLALCVILKGHSLDCTPTKNDHNYPCISSWEPGENWKKANRAVLSSSLASAEWIDPKFWEGHVQ